MKIAVPITATMMDEALQDIDSASKVADIIELRMDYLETSNLDKVVRRLVQHTPKPIIATNRIKAEGGHFEGSEIKRFALLQYAIDLGAAYVDIELDHYSCTFELQSTKLILSHHNFNETPADLNAIYQRMKVHDPHIIKIATKANSPRDSLRMLNFISDVSSEGQDVIGICMGQEGIPTRIYGPYAGGYLTFASLSDGKASAPGQISAYKLMSIWNALGLRT